MRDRKSCRGSTHPYITLPQKRRWRPAPLPDGNALDLRVEASRQKNCAPLRRSRGSECGAAQRRFRASPGTVDDRYRLNTSRHQSIGSLGEVLDCPPICLHVQVGGLLGEIAVGDVISLLC
jgi:hypothetical protein